MGVFPVGDNPREIAFDGESIWVVNREDDTMTRLRASDGANLGTFPVGDSPHDVKFDGTHIWVANWADDTVSKH